MANITAPGSSPRVSPASAQNVAPAGAQALSAANFENAVTNTRGVVVVDFYFPECGPCRVMSPIVDRTATRLAGNATVYKFNVKQDDSCWGQMNRRFGVRGVPHIIVFKDGKPVAEQKGVISAAQLEALVAKAK